MINLKCVIFMHCDHRDYDQPITWEELEAREKHGRFKPNSLHTVKTPPPPPSKRMPAGYATVCCRCGRVKRGIY